jgi:parallel beta-helix repeat protein
LVGQAVSFDASSSTCWSPPCTYGWTDSGTGSTLGAGVKITYAFNSAGTQSVRLTVTDSRGRSASIQKSVQVGNAPTASPTAAYLYSPGAPVTNSPVSFDATSSICPAAPCSYRWTDDADGSLLGTGVTTSYTFKGVGTKYVRLTMTDSQSQSASIQKNVVVSSGTTTTSAPSITSFTPAGGSAGTSVAITGVNLTGASSVRFNGANASFSVSSSTLILATAPSGVTTGPISVTTSAGTATSASDFRVSASAPIVSFVYSPLSPVVNSPVSFDASATLCFASPCNYIWTDTVDNSQLGTGVTMSFTFSSAGTKSVRLAVTDSQSQTASSQQAVVVSSPATPGATGDYYVSASGNDSNPGTSSSPWRTIQKAANTVSPGQTVVVNAGNYAERVSMTRSGSSASPITFKTSGTVVMQGFNIQASYIKVIGFEITNTPGTSPTDRSRGSGVYLSGAGNEVSSNYIHDTVAAGIYMTSSASNTILRNNKIAYAVECAIYINGSGNLVELNDLSHTRSVSGSDADGVRFFGSNNIVRQNYVHDIILSDSPGQSPHIDSFQTWGPASNYIFEQNLIDKQPSQQQGFTIEGLTLPVGNITIRNNIFITRGSGYQPNINTGDLGTVTNTVIVNNTMVSLNSQVEYAVWIFRYQSGVVVRNNSFYNHGNSSSNYVRVDSGASGLDIGFNSVYNSSGSGPAGTRYSGDLFMVNPQFVNVNQLNFKLQPTSPLIDRGTNLSSVPNDYDGSPRPYGTLMDLGAYEYHP